MLNIYHIERANGIEYVVQESYRKYLFSADEDKAFTAFLEKYIKDLSGLSLERFLEHYKGKKEFSEMYAAALTDFRQENHIPLYERFPSVVCRCAIVDNKPAEFYIGFVQSELMPSVQFELNRLIGIFDSLHWRNMIACQKDLYNGSLFESDND